MQSRLPTIRSETILVDGRPQSVVRARAIHAALGIETRFPTWIHRKIRKLALVEHTDFRKLARAHQTDQRDAALSVDAATRVLGTIRNTLATKLSHDLRRVDAIDAPQPTATPATNPADDAPDAPLPPHLHRTTCGLVIDVRLKRRDANIADRKAALENAGCTPVNDRTMDFWRATHGSPGMSPGARPQKGETEVNGNTLEKRRTAVRTFETLQAERGPAKAAWLRTAGPEATG